MSDSEQDEDFGRLFTPCPGVVSQFDADELVRTCTNSCGRFYVRCCSHPDNVCHHMQVVYTDGACTNNGRSSAVSGIGIAFGIYTGDPDDKVTQQFAIPVDDRLDPGGRRTNQRAELLAAIEGLRRACDNNEWLAECFEEFQEERGDDSPPKVIITTDSEYVVKGMTEWLPKWKENGLRKSNGQRPSNLDLFIKLEATVEERERRHGCEVKFWHISRTYNTIADGLAKCGASAAARSVDEELGKVVMAVSALVL